MEDKRHQKAPSLEKFDLGLTGAEAGRIYIYGTAANPTQGVPNPGWTDKYYLSPLPISDLLLNEQLTQNPGWPRTNDK